MRALHLPRSRFGKIALQVGLSVVLIAAILWQADLHRIGNALRDTSPGWFAAAIAINIVATAVMSLRWYLLLLARGRRDPGLYWLFETYSIALLLGQILPTAVGGDAVRAIDLARRTGARAEAVSSVLVDRVVGLAALGALAAGGALAGGTGIGRGTAVALGLGVVAITALAAVALFSLRLRPLLRRLAPLARRLRVEAPLRALYHALHAYRGHPGALGLVFVLGVLAQGMRAVSIWFLAQGMGLGLGFATLLVLCPVLFLVTIVPVSLNGIGLREATFVVVLGGADVGREDAFALGLAFFAVGVLTGALGGLALLRRSLMTRRLAHGA
jgi:glycosyltransferase 2 family protein